jgi:serine O-acetyltransferase
VTWPASWLAEVRGDLDAAIRRDPAARSRLEVLLTYPGVHALLLHRVSHRVDAAGFHLVARVMSHIGRMLTGIEIHPRAQIGHDFFIDHGMGVVIGETAEIGDDVMLYQGVTVGGTSRLREKRHPTLRDNVVVGAHAQLIGAIEVGEGARIGAGSVVVTNVPPYSTVVGVPGRVVTVRFPDTRPIHRLPDPEAETIEALQQRLLEMEERLARLERDSARAR